jgi:hypothetical protein
MHTHTAECYVPAHVLRGLEACRAGSSLRCAARPRTSGTHAHAHLCGPNLQEEPPTSALAAPAVRMCKLRALARQRRWRTALRAQRRCVGACALPRQCTTAHVNRREPRAPRAGARSARAQRAIPPLRLRALTALRAQARSARRCALASMLRALRARGGLPPRGRYRPPPGGPGGPPPDRGGPEVAVPRRRRGAREARP